jgi:hypothetical protein
MTNEPDIEYYSKSPISDICIKMLVDLAVMRKSFLLAFNSVETGSAKEKLIKEFGLPITKKDLSVEKTGYLIKMVIPPPRRPTKRECQLDHQANSKWEALKQTDMKMVEKVD